MGPHASSSEYDSNKRVLDSIRRVVQALRVSSRNAEKISGLSSAQLFVLQQLKLGEKLSMNEIAERTFTHQSTVSEVVGRLLEAKLLTRRPSEQDARRVEISITTKGLAQLKTAPRTTQEELVSALKSMPESRREDLATLMEELLRKTGLLPSLPLTDAEQAPLFFEDKTHRKKPRKKNV